MPFKSELCLFVVCACDYFMDDEMNGSRSCGTCFTQRRSEGCTQASLRSANKLYSLVNMWSHRFGWLTYNHTTRTTLELEAKRTRIGFSSAPNRFSSIRNAMNLVCECHSFELWAWSMMWQAWLPQTLCIRNGFGVVYAQAASERMCFAMLRVWITRKFICTAYWVEWSRLLTATSRTLMRELQLSSKLSIVFT